MKLLLSLLYTLSLYILPSLLFFSFIPLSINDSPPCKELCYDNAETEEQDTADSSCNSSFSSDFEEETDPNQPLILTLENALNIALSTQRRLGGVTNAVINSEINLELAESEFDLRFVPKGDAGYVGGGKAGSGYTLGGGIEIFKKFRQGTRIAIFPSVMKAAHHFQSNVRTVFTQPLFRGFGFEYNSSGIRAAQYGNRTARRSYYLAQVRLMMQTIQGLYDIKRQEAFVELERESLARIKKFCQSTRMKEKIGLCDALDVYRAEIELKRVEDSLDQALDRLQDVKDSIKDTLALPLDLQIEVDVPLEYEIAVIPLDEAIETALSNRVEVDQADDQLEDARRVQYMAKSNLYPELNLVVDYTSLSRDEVFTRIWTYNRESKWGFGLTTSADVSQLRESCAYETSILNTMEAQRNTLQVRDNVTLDVKRTLRSLARSHEKVLFQEQQIENSTKEFHLARVKFEHGLANNFDLIQAEKNLRSAQTGLISAIIDHKIGQFKLLSSLGMLADKPVCR
jgi:outer membrane protein